MTVPVGRTEEEVVAALADGLQTLLSTPELCESLRKKAESWVRKEMLWDRKGDQLQAIYESVLSHTNEVRA